jgi:hypothetical protein
MVVVLGVGWVGKLDSYVVCILNNYKKIVKVSSML